MSGAHPTVIRADVQPWPEGLDATLAEIRRGAASADGAEPLPLVADIMRLGEALHAIGEAATVRVGSMEWKYEPSATIEIVGAQNPAARRASGNRRIEIRSELLAGQAGAFRDRQRLREALARRQRCEVTATK